MMETTKNGAQHITNDVTRINNVRVTVWFSCREITLDGILRTIRNTFKYENMIKQHGNANPMIAVRTTLHFHHQIPMKTDATITE